jgi:DNA mismatch repair protein MutS2
MERESIFVGIEVKLKGSSQTGIVKEINDKKAMCLVEVNGKNIRVNFSHLLPLKEGKKKNKISKSQTSYTTSNPSSSKIEKLTTDLHGKTRAEAHEILISLLDSALLKGVQKLEIIHGLGNGILKKEVTEFLSQSNYIASFKTDDLNQGVIIAYLK